MSSASVGPKGSCVLDSGETALVPRTGADVITGLGTEEEGSSAVLSGVSTAVARPSDTEMYQTYQEAFAGTSSHRNP
ncbi:hypothetical protein F443_13884 [Phytophthora nicotianae P1569]|uniref:Uncharacterized protein n=1 Tax=Phytophthora nicotianae P1569 TaxID=1317065 RepID=V9ENG3_PHYNI|nr:hypothetical protein F443_13884 [Phytophthora nicotianae P1569]